MLNLFCSLEALNRRTKARAEADDEHRRRIGRRPAESCPIDCADSAKAEIGRLIRLRRYRLRFYTELAMIGPVGASSTDIYAAVIALSRSIAGRTDLRSLLSGVAESLRRIVSV